MALLHRYVLASSRRLAIGCFHEDYVKCSLLRIPLPRQSVMIGLPIGHDFREHVSTGSRRHETLSRSGQRNRTRGESLPSIGRSAVSVDELALILPTNVPVHSSVGSIDGHSLPAATDLSRGSTLAPHSHYGLSLFADHVWNDLPRTFDQGSLGTARPIFRSFLESRCCWYAIVGDQARMFCRHLASADQRLGRCLADRHHDVAQDHAGSLPIEPGEHRVGCDYGEPPPERGRLRDGPRYLPRRVVREPRNLDNADLDGVCLRRDSGHGDHANDDAGQFRACSYIAICNGRRAGHTLGGDDGGSDTTV